MLVSDRTWIWIYKIRIPKYEFWKHFTFKSLLNHNDTDSTTVKQDKICSSSYWNGTQHENGQCLKQPYWINKWNVLTTDTRLAVPKRGKFWGECYYEWTENLYELGSIWFWLKDWNKIKRSLIRIRKCPLDKMSSLVKSRKHGGYSSSPRCTFSYPQRSRRRQDCRRRQAQWSQDWSESTSVSFQGRAALSGVCLRGRNLVSLFLANWGI